MSTIVKRIIAVIVAVAIVGSAAVYKYLDSKVYYNDSDVNGNTIGNLYGNGLFCEYEGLVYFANPNDDNALYSMKIDESDVKKICDDRVYFINVDDHYIYYSRDNNNDESQMSFLNVNTNSLCRINKDGKKITILDDAVCSTLGLSKNTLYYHHYDKDEATTLYSIGIDGKDKKQIFDNSTDPRCIVGPTLYYSGVVTDHNIYKRDLNTGSTSTLVTESSWMPTIYGNYVYYMDLADKEKVVRVSLSDGSKETLSTYGSSDYNVSGNYIYYQSIKADEDGIYQIDLTTKEERLIAPGQFHSINLTSKYIYFVDYFSGACYHCDINGGVATIFSPAIELKTK